jgi:hypothetical protein
MLVVLVLLWLLHLQEGVEGVGGAFEAAEDGESAVMGGEIPTGTFNRFLRTHTFLS